MVETSRHAGPIYTSPPLTIEDSAVLGEIHEMRRSLEANLRPVRRWNGVLRRTQLARAVRGSNSIEGYTVAEDEAAAALNDEEPLTADEATFAEIRGYRQALGYALANANDEYFIFDTSSMRAMHYMMLGHDLSKSPGQYRRGPIYVRDERTGQNVYEGPPADDLGDLMDVFAASLRAGAETDPLVRGAMAHLNLVMIHPFRDGNGRMARALQTLVIARAQIADPAFCSIEEWLGRNTEDYYRVLALTSYGSWHPHPDVGFWVSFNLRAHHMQAQTLRRRIAEVEAVWIELDDLILGKRLPERSINIMFEALIGYRVRRSGYIKDAEIDTRTASRDLARLVHTEVLQPHGETSGRHYTAGPALLEIQQRRRQKQQPLTDPYPWLRQELALSP
jgi:Fic family protein